MGGTTRQGNRWCRKLAVLVCAVLALAACNKKPEAAAPEIRPVRTVVAAPGEFGETVVMTGHVAAETEAALGFRIPGRMIERSVKIGDHVEAGQVLARLDPQDEVGGLRSAQAAEAGAKARLAQAQDAFERQRQLLAGGHTPRAAYDQAQEAFRTAPQIETLNASLPAGFHVDVGGTVEESGKSQDSLLAVVPAMLLVMTALLMMQLQSFNRLLLVFSTVPMGLIGVIGGLLLFRQPLGFVALLGVLLLLGMIARNGVILIEQIEIERSEGRAAWEAVVEATLSRFRPIMLTAISTVLGPIPIAITIFWGPMAVAIMGGLIVATVLTLAFLPALYVTWFGIKEPSAGAEPSPAGAAAATVPKL